MKRVGFILLVSLAVAAAAYCGMFHACMGSHCAMLESDKPELAWLKKEFNLSDAEFKRVAELHAAYLPHCQERCQQIDAQHLRLKQLLTATNQVTTEIETAIAESARLRGECQREMLQHFFEVSRTMPPEQGRRYLAWVQEKTFAPDFGMRGKP
jgi:Heavy-metal resistance